MSLSLTTFSSGAVIDASTLRARLLSIETYLNEEIAAADRGTGWCGANRLYRPDFFGAPNPHTTMPSGESYYRRRTGDARERIFFSYYVNTGGWLPVPGMSIPIQVPELLDMSGTDYRLMVFCSFYVYEMGGGGALTTLDDDTTTAASVALSLDGSTGGSVNITVRNIFQGADAGSANVIPAFTRKQHSMSYAWVGSAIDRGLHNVGVIVRTNNNTDATKHIIFQQGTMTARYFVR